MPPGRTEKQYHNAATTGAGTTEGVEADSKAPETLLRRAVSAWCGGKLVPVRRYVAEALVGAFWLLGQPIGLSSPSRRFGYYRSRPGGGKCSLHRTNMTFGLFHAVEETLFQYYIYGINNFASGVRSQT